MTIKEYINKNLPNLNWNILPQVFEEESIELTEEIKAYLKETPGNTNWNVFKGMSGNGSAIRVTLFDGTLTPQKVEDDWIAFFMDGEAFNYNKIIVTFEGVKYNLNKIDTSIDKWYGDWAYGEAGEHGVPIFDTYPFNIYGLEQIMRMALVTPESGTYSVKIEVEEE